MKDTELLLVGALAVGALIIISNNNRTAGTVSGAPSAGSPWTIFVPSGAGQGLPGAPGTAGDPSNQLGGTGTLVNDSCMSAADNPACAGYMPGPMTPLVPGPSAGLEGFGAYSQ